MPNEYVNMEQQLRFWSHEIERKFTPVSHSFYKNNTIFSDHTFQSFYFQIYTKLCPNCTSFFLINRIAEL
jgi:hypothetical protein